MLEVNFRQNDPSLESQWRAIILFGKNSATYKFSFAKSLLEFVEKGQTRISLNELAVPFSKHITEHLKENDRQGNSRSSQFLDTCRAFNKGQLSHDELIGQTEKKGFVNVVDAFQVVNGANVPKLFYEKDYSRGSKGIILKDSLLSLTESKGFKSLELEAEARWRLVETAWNLSLNPNLLEVKYDSESSLFFIEDPVLRRKDITQVRDSLNGYQKGKCFYTETPISIKQGDPRVCHVDHVLPRAYLKEHQKEGANIDGVWNLVLADPDVNGNKLAKTPGHQFIERLYNRNEYYIRSKHPLAETILNQTGKSAQERRDFLQKHFEISHQNSMQIWRPI
jgi:hypothetical protein